MAEKEMTALECLERYGRMCKSQEDCVACPMAKDNNGKNVFCDQMMRDYPRETLQIMLKWAEGQPKKTRLTEFLKQFPNAELNDGYPCGCVTTYDVNTMKSTCAGIKCKDCKAKFWNEPIKEDTP